MNTHCQCQLCGQPVEFDEVDSGRSIPCPGCGQEMQLITALEIYAAQQRRASRRGKLIYGICITIAAFIVCSFVYHQFGKLLEADSKFAWRLFSVTCVCVSLAVLYFIPSMVGRHKANAGAIFALNLFLGWTFIGWVVALVWALTVDTKTEAHQ